MGAGALYHASRLIVLRPEFLIFQTNQNLPFFNLVAFFYAYPRHAAGDFGIGLNLVVRDDIAGGGKDGCAGSAAAFCGGACDLDLMDIAGKQAISEHGQAQQRHDDNSNSDDAPGPRRRLSTFGALRAVDTKALQVVVFSVNRHNEVCRKA